MSLERAHSEQQGKVSSKSHRTEHDVAVLAVIDRDLLAVIEDVDGAGLEVVDDELLPGDPAAAGEQRGAALVSEWRAQPGAGRSSAGGEQAHWPGFLTTTSPLRLSAMKFAFSAAVMGGMWPF